jgi:hypothetical protein
LLQKLFVAHLFKIFTEYVLFLHEEDYLYVGYEKATAIPLNFNYLISVTLQTLFQYLYCKIITTIYAPCALLYKN